MIPEVAGGVSEDRVSDAAFELVFAFDEVGLICIYLYVYILRVCPQRREPQQKYKQVCGSRDTPDTPRPCVSR